MRVQVGLKSVTAIRMQNVCFLGFNVTTGRPFRYCFNFTT